MVPVSGPGETTLPLRDGRLDLRHPVEGRPQVLAEAQLHVRQLLARECQLVREQAPRIRQGRLPIGGRRRPSRGPSLTPRRDRRRQLHGQFAESQYQGRDDLPAFNDDLPQREKDRLSQARHDMDGPPGAEAIGQAGNRTSDPFAAVVELRTHAPTNVAIRPSVPLPDYDREAGPRIAVDADWSLLPIVPDSRLATRDFCQATQSQWPSRPRRVWLRRTSGRPVRRARHPAQLLP
jgi:hypothetical protein